MTKVNLKNFISITVLLTFAFYFINTKLPEWNFWKYSFVSLVIFLIIYILNFLYEKYLWNKHKYVVKIFTIVGFQKYPNISGEWKMKYNSSYKDDWDKSIYMTKGTGKIKIRKIDGGFLYSGNFDKSKFKSKNNFFENNKNNNEEWILGYRYLNDPKETNIANTGFVGHSGFTILNFDENNPNEITGFYGNDENRKTRGRIILEKNLPPSD